MEKTGFQAGVSILLYSDGGDFEKLSPLLLDRLAELNINSISLVFPLFQADWRSVEIYKDTQKTPSDENLKVFIREAHKRNFTVMLRPILDEASLVKSGKWRGQLSPTDRSTWFANYSAQLVGYAELAEKEKVAILDIGTEFVSLESETALWKELITKVRTKYAGQVTYSANWDSQAPGFVHLLDFASIDAYYPLDAPIGASVASLSSSWTRWIDDIKAKGYEINKVVFTELGTLPRQGSHQKPWNYLLDSPPDLQTQARYYQATCAVFKPLIKGIYWWQVDLALPKTNDNQDLGYSPIGKPTEAVLSDCYR